jgi:hypothetical protein
LFGFSFSLRLRNMIMEPGPHALLLGGEVEWRLGIGRELAVGIPARRAA